MISLIRKHPELHGFLQDIIDDDWASEFQSPNQDGMIWKSWSQYSLKPIISIAAAIALLVIGVIGIWGGQKQNNYLVYTTNYGETKEVALPDGSRLTLNANSSAIWLKEWQENGRRIIKLEGEGFFEVAHIESGESGAIPFDVTTENVKINVLGTSFNVEARRDDTKVYLEEGEVRLNVKDDTEVLLKPGEQVIYNNINEKIKLSENETIESAASWKNGVISFREEKLEVILLELSDIFGKEFECSDRSLLAKPMDIGVPFMNWEATKESLELSMNIIIKQNGEIYEITNNN